MYGPQSGARSAGLVWGARLIVSFSKVFFCGLEGAFFFGFPAGFSREETISFKETVVGGLELGKRLLDRAEGRPIRGGESS